MSSEPPDDASSGDAAVRQAVLDYLREHPRAMDTLEGIAQWWLVRQRVRTEVRLVARALADLERHGVLERTREGGQAMYRLRGREHGEGGEITERAGGGGGETPVGGDA